MNKYTVRITETLEKDVIIEADSEKDALQITDNNWRMGRDEYILSADNFKNVNMEVVNNG